LDQSKANGLFEQIASTDSSLRGIREIDPALGADWNSLLSKEEPRFIIEPAGPFARIPLRDWRSSSRIGNLQRRRFQKLTIRETGSRDVDVPALDRPRF